MLGIPVKCALHIFISNLHILNFQISMSFFEKFELSKNVLKAWLRLSRISQRKSIWITYLYRREYFSLIYKLI